MSESEADRRRHIRFHPSRNSVVVVTDSPGDDGLVGLLRDEAEGGCAGLFHRDCFPYEIGDGLHVRTDGSDVRRASVVWTRPIDKRFLKVGLEYVTDAT